MSRVSFKNDYSEGAHSKILDLLVKTNSIQQEGYGEDEYTQKAKSLILKKLNKADAKIYFTAGGTQTNLLVIGSILKSYESVISAQTGHISVNETGAIEATGHKVSVANSQNGKLQVKDIEDVIHSHKGEHMVKPKMVYISNTTELGSIYTKDELTKLSDFCRENKLLLYMDGARLGSALTSKNNDLTLEDFGKLVDIFYIGGTKNGGLLGEAIVFNRPELGEDFRYYLKQRGALLAKGRLLGIQFLGLFEDDLFFELAQHANEMSSILADNLRKNDIRFLHEPESNQIFPILPNSLIEKLQTQFDFYVWRKYDEEYSVARLVTSWHTRKEDIESFADTVKKLSAAESR